MIKRSLILTSILLFILLAGCGNETVSPDLTVPISGVWGGRHVELNADASEARFEFDCASGYIARQLRSDKAGRIDVMGNYSPGTPGPADADIMPEVHPARYQGQVFKGMLTLKITLTDTGKVIGTFTLFRGERGDVYYCY